MPGYVIADSFRKYHLSVRTARGRLSLIARCALDQDASRTVTSLPHGALIMPRRADDVACSVRVPLDLPGVGAGVRLLVRLVRARGPFSGSAAAVGHADRNHHRTPGGRMAVGRLLDGTARRHRDEHRRRKGTVNDRLGADRDHRQSATLPASQQPNEYGRLWRPWRAGEISCV